MIEYHAPALSDRDWVKSCAAQGTSRGSEYGFTTLFLWGKAYDQSLALVDGFLSVHAHGPLGCSYLWPAGAGDLSAVLDQLEADAAARGCSFRLIGMTPDAVEALERLRPGQFRIDPDRSAWDYLYEIDKLADLGGRKLHSKRNHCKRFQENNPDWVYEDLTPDHIPECLEMARAWEKSGREREGARGAESIGMEESAMLTAMEHFDRLALEGGLIRAEGRVVAWTMGGPLTNDTFDVHFEKAYGEIQGAYAMINREFARRVRERHPEIRYLNREEDMGLESLRKAKSSYYPDLMAEKYTAVRKYP